MLKPTQSRVLIPVLAALIFFSCSSGDKEKPSPQNESLSAGTIIWNIDNLDAIDGNPVTVEGSPKVIDTPNGKAVEFDGEGDGLFIDTHPLAGATALTLEVIFRPDAEGLAEQRFFHLQENGGDNRFLIETRLTGDGYWYLDTFIKSNDMNQTLIDDTKTHPVGEWYNATLVFDGSVMSHYVNGVLEISAPIASFTPQGEGKSSIGVRINKVFWFKGAIRKARFTKRALTPDEFLKP